MYKYNKLLKQILKILLIVSLNIVILFSLLQYYSFDVDFYMKEYRKYNITNVTKMNYEDLERVTNKLISYLKNEEKNLNIKANIDGKIEEVFGEREKKHMVDVKKLFNIGYKIRNIAIILIFIVILIIIKTIRNSKRALLISFLYTGIIPIILSTMLFILVKIDFHKYFTHFHKIFFTNDLWLLNPKTDVLIQMLPLGFFIDITITVLTWYIVISLVMVVASAISLRKIKV